jgi:hypothetical protein
MKGFGCGWKDAIMVWDDSERDKESAKPGFLMWAPVGYAPSSNSLTMLTKRLATLQSVHRFFVQSEVPRAIPIRDDRSADMVFAWFSAYRLCIPLLLSPKAALYSVQRGFLIESTHRQGNRQSSDLLQSRCE